MSNYWSGKGAGSKIVIKFDKALLGDVTGNESAFTVTGYQRNPLRIGELQLKEYTVDSVERYPVATLFEDDFDGGDADGVELGPNGLRLIYTFSPLDIPGLQLWLDAAQITGLSDGDPVATWPDMSGEGNHATQATSGNRPTYRAGVLNGLPVVRFDGTNDFLTLGKAALGSTGLFAAAGQAFTVFAVSRVAPNSIGTIIGRAATSNRTFQLFYQRTSNPAWTPSFYLRGTQNNTGYEHDDGNGHLDAVRWDGSTATYFGDGVPQSATVGSASENTSEHIIIGARTGGTAFWLNGDIAEILIFDVALSPGDRQVVEQYLMTKYAIGGE